MGKSDKCSHFFINHSCPKAYHIIQYVLLHIKGKIIIPKSKNICQLSSTAVSQTFARILLIPSVWIWIAETAVMPTLPLQFFIVMVWDYVHVEQWLLTGPFSSPQMTQEWIQRNSKVTLTWENWRTHSKPVPVQTVYNTVHSLPPQVSYIIKLLNSEVYCTSANWENKVIKCSLHNSFYEIVRIYKGRFE